MSKRSHGEGSISKRINGTWLAQLTIEGKRKSKTFRIKKDAQEWLSIISGQVNQGLTYSGTTTTVEVLINDWLSIKKTKLRLATNEQYRRLSKLYIKPYLGNLKIHELNAAKIQNFYMDLDNKKTGRRTIEIVHSILHGFLDYALRLGLVAQNWAALVEVPRPKKREMSVWNENQVNQFILFVNNDPFYKMAFATGMRRGELIGLQWKDLDWGNELIHVRRQVYNPEGGGFIFQEPKTDRGRRSIRLGKNLLQSLKYQFNQVIPQMIAIAGDDWKENDLIFPSSVGTPRNGYNVTKEFNELVESAGLPKIRFHDIRHSVASIMLLHGEPPSRVAGILGQSIAVLLSTYAHYIHDEQETVSRIMDEITTPNLIIIKENQIRES